MEQHKRLTGIQAKNIFLDRGYRGPKKINDTYLYTPKPDKNITTTKRRRHKRRAAIEPTIGQLKHDHRVIRNYLKGTVGDAMNFKPVMNIFKKKMLVLVQDFLSQLYLLLKFILPVEIKLTFCGATN